MEEFSGIDERILNDLLKEQGLRICDEETNEDIPEDDFIDKNQLLGEESFKRVAYTKEEAASLIVIAKRIGELKQNDKKLNRYDYFILGGINIPRAMAVVYSMYLDKRLNKIEYKNIKDFLVAQKLVLGRKDYDFIMNTYYQFGSYVISLEEKKNIWNNLLAKGIASENIDDIVFSGAVREYAIEHRLIQNLKPKKRKRQKRK